MCSRLTPFLCRTLAVLFVLPCAGLARAAATCPPPVQVQEGTAAAERDRGLLWRISRDGRSGYLYGMLHVGKPTWRCFGPQLNAALNSRWSA